MQPIRIANSSIDTITLETKLSRMKQLAGQIKILEAEYDMLKRESIDGYFVLYPEYRTDKGLLLASYKPQEMMQFQQSKFKADHADIYTMYSESKTVYKFLLK